MELGRSCDGNELNERINALKANQCCTLVYTVSTFMLSLTITMS